MFLGLNTPQNERIRPQNRSETAGRLCIERAEFEVFRRKMRGLLPVPWSIVKRGLLRHRDGLAPLGPRGAAAEPLPARLCTRSRYPYF